MKNENSDYEEQNLNSEDSYSDQSLSSEDSNSFEEEEDNWIVPKKNYINKSVKRITKEYIVARKVNKVCCKNTFSQTEAYYKFKLKKKEKTIRRFKMDAKRQAMEYIKNM